MASALIHICVAKEVNKYLKMNEYDLLLGSIAPDLSKQIGQTKEISHFLDHTNEDDIPNIDRFLKKYQQELNKPFTMGYFIHLLTDKYWFRDYVYQYIERYTHDEVKKGVTYTALKNLIYNDYTNLNSDLIDKYNLDLNIFYNPLRIPDTSITEINVENLDILLEKMGIILEESKKEKSFIFDMKDIEIFIYNSVNYIIKDLKILGFAEKK